MCTYVCVQQQRGTVYTPKHHSIQLASQFLSEVERKGGTIPNARLIRVMSMCVRAQTSVCVLSSLVTQCPFEDNRKGVTRGRKEKRETKEGGNGIMRKIGFVVEIFDCSVFIFHYY